MLRQVLRRISAGILAFSLAFNTNFRIIAETSDEEGFQENVSNEVISGQESTENDGGEETAAPEQTDVPEETIQETESPEGENPQITEGDGQGETPVNPEPDPETVSPAEGETPEVTETPDPEQNAEEVSNPEETADPEAVNPELTPTEGEEEEGSIAEGAEETPKETEYTYEDDYVIVTAALEKAEAVPDEARLSVVQVTSSSKDYDYDGYMNALNENPDEEYSSENTLLYDISFRLDDEEYEPEDGSVSIKIDFKDNTLKETFGEENESEVEIKHLSENDGDITVEDVTDPSVSMSDEAVEFTTDSLSVFAITARNLPEGTNQFNTWFNVHFEPTAEDQDISGIKGYYLVSVITNIKYNAGPGNLQNLQGKMISLTAIDEPADEIRYGIASQQYIPEVKVNSYSKTKDQADYWYSENDLNEWTQLVYDDDTVMSFYMISGDTGLSREDLYNRIKDNNTQIVIPVETEGGVKVGDYNIDSASKEYIPPSGPGEFGYFRGTVKLSKIPDYSVTVKTYDYDSETPYAPESLPGNYYIRVTGKDADENEYYAVKPITLNGRTSSSVSIKGMIPVTSNFNNETPDDGAGVVSAASVTIERNDVRLVTGNFGWGTTYETVMNADDTVPGMDFMSNEQSGDKRSSEISLHRAFDKEFNYRVIFDPEAYAISADDLYFVFITVEHDTTGNSYYLAPLAVSETTAVPVTEWRDNNGNVLPNEKFTGKEKSITVRVLKSKKADLSINNAIQGTDCAVIQEGEAVKIGTVSYADDPDIVDDPAAHISRYYYDITLTKIDASNDYNFLSVLGDAVYYGITAQEFEQ